MDLQDRFPWITFYENVADNLLRFKDNREELVAAVHSINKQLNFKPITDRFKDGTKGLLKDICPFTTLARFNRYLKDANRTKIAAELAKFLGVKEDPPNSFPGIPTMYNQNSWLFAFHKNRRPDDINTLWQIFEQAIYFSQSEDSPNARNTFVEAYDKASQVAYASTGSLTMGLYWIRPRIFTPLDHHSENYIEQSLGIHIGRNGIDKRCSGNDYLTLIDELNKKFREESCPVDSFPELSLVAWEKPGNKNLKSIIPAPQLPLPDKTASRPEVRETTPLVTSYSIANILAEGCFLKREKLEVILQRLSNKKNLILQGPPGTGKTWLAKKLAFAVIGERDEDKIRPVQFHPNLSYEDFVRGWRPSGDGKLDLVDGPFLQMINTAKDDPESQYAIIIEEINRGNPAQIFGEMLTLLESDKRKEAEALELSYRKSEGERVYIPENLYVIGTMNVADRSIAMVDFALRRRFAFVDLEPIFGNVWQDWVHNQCKIDEEFLSQVEDRMKTLNKQIAEDSNLGAQFRVGHSYVTPSAGEIDDSREWFKQVVETEIGPLLDEYWFDALDTAQKAREQLLEGL